MLRVSPSCGNGADVSVMPPTAADVQVLVRADDGKPVVVALQPHKPTFDVQVQGSSPHIVHIDLS